MSIFDGLKLAVDTPARLILTHPITGQPLRDAEGADAWIDVLAISSTVGRAHDRIITDRRMKQGQARVTAEQLELDMTEKLAKLTRGWYLIALDGAPLNVPFNETTARECYGQPELLWLREQVFQFAADLGNFRPPLATS